MNEIVEKGVQNVWFYAHQPGERRELVVEFYNCLITQINNQLDVNLPLLTKHKL